MDDLSALKLLLEVEAGENATFVAILYFVTSIATPLLTAVVFLTLFWLAYRLARREITGAKVCESMMRWRDTLCIGRPGMLTAWEADQVSDCINRLVAAHAKECADPKNPNAA